MPSPIQPSPLSEYLRTIARKGGKSRSPAKLAAVLANLATANAARRAKRAKREDSIPPGSAGPRTSKKNNRKD